MSKYSFGNYAIVSGITFSFQKEPEWEWTVLPVTSGKELEMSKFNMPKVSIDPDGTRRQIPPTWMELCYREIAMTFGGTTIPKDTEKPVKEGGQPILKDNASLNEIEAVLEEMPQDMVMEIWRKVGEAYPKWGPADPNLI